MKKSTLCIIVLLLFSLIVCDIKAFAEPIDIDDLKYYDFDVHENTDDKATSAPLSILTFVVYFICFVIIAALAYLTTRWIGKQQKKLRVKSKYMEIIDSLHLGGDNAIHIVKSPAGFLLVGSGREGVLLLAKLGDEEAELIEQAEENQIEESFSAQLNNYLSKIKWNIDHKSGGSK